MTRGPGEEDQGGVHRADGRRFQHRGAIAELFELARETNKLMHHEMLSKKGAKGIIALFEEFDQILGILPGMEHSPDQFDDIMEVIVNIRQELRKRKLYDLADR